MGTLYVNAVSSSTGPAHIEFQSLVSSSLGSTYGGPVVVSDALNVSGAITAAGAVTITGDLTVNGTTTSLNQTQIDVTNAFVFEGASANAHETTLGIVDPTADATINLPAMSAGTYHLPVLAAASTTSISSTPEELNLLDGASAGTVVNSKAVIYSSDGDIVVGDNLQLTSDSAAISMGADGDILFAHDGTSGLTISATPISIDSTGELHLNSTTGDIKFQDGGTDQLALDMDGTAGEVIMQLKVDSDDFVFKQYDGTEVFRVEDNGDFDIAGGLGSTGVTVTSAGAISADSNVSSSAAIQGQTLNIQAGATITGSTTHHGTLTSTTALVAQTTLSGAGGLSGQSLTVQQNVTGAAAIQGQTLAIQNGATITGSSLHHGTFKVESGLLSGSGGMMVGGLANFSNNIETSGSLTTSGSILIADDQTIRFGNDQDAEFGYKAIYDAPVIDTKDGSLWVLSTTETTEKPELVLNNGFNGSTGPHITFSKTRGYDGSNDRVVVDDDIVGNITFAGADGDNTSTSYARIQGKATDVTANAQCGELGFFVQNSGSLQKIMTVGGRDVGNGPDYSAVTLAGDTTLVGERLSATNLGANGSVPITGLTANVDANGSARTGIRFAGSGVAGQMLIVQNTGGENLTFDATEGTSLLKGVATANDTMLPGGTYVFISDGSRWVLIGGGAATDAVGLAAG